jgi:hypothetical protein
MSILNVAQKQDVNCILIYLLKKFYLINYFKIKKTYQKIQLLDEARRLFGNEEKFNSSVNITN